jgi:hypothetical protein
MNIFHPLPLRTKASNNLMMLPDHSSKRVKLSTVHTVKVLVERRPQHYRGVSGLCEALTALYTPRERTPVPTGQEARWASEPVWTQAREKIVAPTGDQTLVI